jgi:hypothetical protein
MVTNLSHVRLSKELKKTYPNHNEDYVFLEFWERCADLVDVEVNPKKLSMIDYLKFKYRWAQIIGEIGKLMCHYYGTEHVDELDGIAVYLEDTYNSEFGDEDAFTCFSNFKKSHDLFNHEDEDEDD